MSPIPRILLLVSAALLLAACASTAPHATSTAQRVDVSSDRQGQQASGVLGVRVLDRSADLRARRGTTNLQVQIANGLPWDVQVRRTDFMLVDSEGRRYHAAAAMDIPGQATASKPGSPSLHLDAAAEDANGAPALEASFAGYMPRPTHQPPTTSHPAHGPHVHGGTTYHRPRTSSHYRHGGRAGVHVGVGSYWGYGPYASWHGPHASFSYGPYASWGGPCSSWRCGAYGSRSSYVVVTPRAAPERRPPPAPMARADVGQMFRTVAELGDDSLQPGGEVAGILTFTDVPSDRDLTLVWTPRSWHGPRQMDAVEVPVTLSRRR